MPFYSRSCLQALDLLYLWEKCQLVMSRGKPLVCLKWFNEALDHDTSGAVLIIWTAPSASLIINSVQWEFSSHTHLEVFFREHLSGCSSRGSRFLLGEQRRPGDTSEVFGLHLPGSQSSREDEEGRNMCSSARLFQSAVLGLLSYHIHVSPASCGENAKLLCPGRSDSVRQIDDHETNCAFL